MTSRRDVLKLYAAATAGLAGCSDSSSDGQTPDGAASGQQDTPAPSGEGTTHDIREYGAAVDGETDDTAAVRGALDAADPGDTVVFPAGTTLVSADDKSRAGAAAIRIDERRHPADLTLQGVGENSVVRMDGGHEANHKLLEIGTGPGIERFALRNMKLDGAASEQEQPDGNGGWNVHVERREKGSAVADVTFRNVWSVAANQNGFMLGHGNCTLVRCTAVDCELHGFATDVLVEEGSKVPRIVVRNCYAANNGLYGIDCSAGRVLVEDFVSENNRQGTKTTPKAVEATYRRCRFKNNDTIGYNRTPTETKTGQRATVTFTDVISEGNGWVGFRFGFDTDYTVDTIVARRNNGTDENTANIKIEDNAAVDAALVLSYDARNGAGIRYNSSAQSRIDTYVHGGNPGGDLIADKAGLAVGEILTREDFREKRMQRADDINEEITELARLTEGGILNVPTAAEVGAGSGP